MAILERARRAVTAWFSAEGPAVNLAVVRIVVFWLLYDRLVSGGFTRYARLPEELRLLPPGFDAVLRTIPLDVPTLLAIQVAATVCCVLALVGLWTRPAAALATLLGCYVLGTPYMFGKVDHTLHHVIWFAALLAASPSGDALSLDAWRARRRGVSPPGPARAYALPIRLMWILMGVIYFFPGLYKLRAGPDWVLSDNLKFFLYESWRSAGALPALRVDQFPELYQAAAAGTILFELGFIFLVLPRRTRPFAALAGLLFHASTAYFMRIYFVELALAYVVFVDWSRLFSRFRRAPAPGSAARAAPEWRASAVVGAALIAANVVCGFARIDSWPFSVFPRFDRIRSEPTTTRVEVLLENGEATRPLKLPLRDAMLDRIAEIPDPVARERRLRALAQVVASGRADLGPDAPLRVYRTTYSTLPGEWQDPPLRRELLFDYAAGRDVPAAREP